jgi:hypothetical protein
MSDAPAGGELEIMRTARDGHGSAARPARTSRSEGAASNNLRVKPMVHPSKSLMMSAMSQGAKCKFGTIGPKLATGFRDTGLETWISVRRSL